MLTENARLSLFVSLAIDARPHHFVDNMAPGKSQEHEGT